MTTRTLVIGLGNPDRGDDAVGLLVTRQVAERVGQGVGQGVGQRVRQRVPQPGSAQSRDVRVIELDDPSEALDAWLGADNVVVTDAVRSGAHPGDVHIVDAAAGPVPVAGWASGGTHAMGLAAVVELARAIRRLPSGLVLVCVEAERFDHGAPLSEAVAVAVPAAVAAVVAAIEQLELTTEDALPATEWLRSAGEERTGEG